MSFNLHKEGFSTSSMQKYINHSSVEASSIVENIETFLLFFKGTFFPI